MDYIELVSGNIMEYNSRIFDYDWSPREDAMTALLTTSTQVSKLYAAIHVSDSTKTPKFQFSAEEVDLAYKPGNLIDYSWYYNYLIEANFPFIVMAGEFDMKDGAAGQMHWMKQTLTSLNDDFWTQDRKIYEFDAQGHTQIGGYYQTQANFTLLTVPKSGHFIPADIYSASKAYLDDYT